jgi:ABC-type multidrug transport system ATPase subunit
VSSIVVLAQHVTKWYGPRRAVSDVSFAIEPGEIVGLLGPNGSGKSTIFRILTGYLAPSSGRVEVAGHDVVTDSLAVRQAISYVPEDAPLYEHMHVAEFLHFMARIKGLRGAAKKKAVKAAAERLDLLRVMSLPTGFDRMMAYSGRYRMRVDGCFITIVDSAWYPAWIGTEQTNFFTLDGDTLSIISPLLQHPKFPNDRIRGVAIWRKE